MEIKQEHVSQDELQNVSTKSHSPSKSKDKMKRAKQKDLKTEDLISKLLSNEIKHLATKRKHKSHNSSQDLSSGAPTPKKIKVEKHSEDEPSASTPKHVMSKEKSNPSIRKANRSLPDVVTQVRQQHKQDYINDSVISKERQKLEELFQESAAAASKNVSSTNKLSDRHSLPKPKHSSGKKLLHSQSDADVPHKQNYINDSVISKEREKLEKLFQKSAVAASKNVNSTNKLSERHSLPNSKHSNANKLLYSQSDARVSVSKPETIKPTSSKSPKGVVNKKVPLPIPIKTEKSSSSGDSSSEEVKKQNNRQSIEHGSEEESSSNEEVPVPEPRLIKVEPSKSPKGGVVAKQKVPLPIPIKAEVRSSSGDSSSEEEPINTNKIVKKQKNRQSIEQGSEEESSSNEEVPVPKPRLIKVEASKSPKGSVVAKQKVPLPIPIKAEVRSSSGDSSSEEEPINTNKIVKKQKNRQSIEQGSEEESSSNEEVPVPKPRLIKVEASKSPKGGIVAKQKVPLPIPIKAEVRSSSGDSSSEEEPINTNKIVKKQNNRQSIQHGSEEESSSNEEVPVPKPRLIKVEASKSPKGSVVAKQKVPLPIPIKAEVRSSSGDSSSEEEPRNANNIVKKPNNRQSIKHGSEEESSSNEEVPVPKPRLIKVEASKSPKGGVVAKQKVPLPIPIKAEVRYSSGDSSSEEEPRKANSTRKKQNNEQSIDQVSEEEWSSDEEVPVPKPRIIKVEASKSQKRGLVTKKKVALPIPIKTKVPSSSGDSSSEEEAPSNVLRKENYQSPQEDNSSSDEEVPVPKPQVIKAETSKSPKAGRAKTKSVPLPIPIKTKVSSSSEDSSSEEEAAHTTNTILRKSETTEQQSESSSENEMPPPKKTKLNNSIGASPSQKVQFPMPIKVKREKPIVDQSESLNDENVSRNSSSVLDTSTSELSWKEKSQYRAMNWIEKIKHRFPGITEQSVDTRLPKKNVKYSLLLTPKNIDPRSLINLKCHLKKKTVVTLNQREYVFEPLPKRPDPVIVNLNGPRLIELQNVISLQQHVPQLTLNEIAAPKREDISLPSAIKARHPLFGVTYKDKLKMNKKIKRKLQEAADHKRRVEEKERRKKKKKKYSRGVEQGVLNIFDSIRTFSDDLFPV